MKDIFKENGSAKSNLLLTSIILSAILVIGSVFYNTKLLIKHFDNALKGQADNTQVKAQADNATSTPEALANVPIRNGAPVLGSNDAKVTIYEFSDFQCPFCEKFTSETFGQIKSKYIDTGKVKFVFRHFPLPSHKNAQIASEAAECANLQGKFWQYHDVLFKNGKSDGTGLAAIDLKKYASQLGLDQSKFNQCLDSGETASVVKQDANDGIASGATGTPTLIVNGKKIYGAQPFAVFQQAIEEELKK